MQYLKVQEKKPFLFIYSNIFFWFLPKFANGKVCHVPHHYSISFLSVGKQGFTHNHVAIDPDYHNMIKNRMRPQRHLKCRRTSCQVVALKYRECLSKVDEGPECTYLSLQSVDDNSHTPSFLPFPFSSRKYICRERPSLV